jgi:CheY-like chemotaxis protein
MQGVLQKPLDEEKVAEVIRGEVFNRAVSGPESALASIAAGYIQNERVQPLQIPNATTGVPNGPLHDAGPTSRPASRRVELLLVDDSSYNLELCAIDLNLSGYPITIARGATEALHLMKRNEYTVVFCGLNMPHKSGTQMTIEFREWEMQNRTTIQPIYAMTGFEDDANTRKCLEAGMQGVLLRPLNKEKVAAVLQGEMFDGAEPDVEDSSAAAITAVATSMQMQSQMQTQMQSQTHALQPQMQSQMQLQPQQQMPSQMEPRPQQQMQSPMEPSVHHMSNSINVVESALVKLLIIDDFSIFLESCVVNLERSGYHVTTCHQADALYLMKNSKYNVVFCALNLPNGVSVPHKSGIEITIEFREWERQNRTTIQPIFAMTGSRDDTKRRECLEAGMQGVLPRALDTEKVAAVLQALQGGGTTMGSHLLTHNGSEWV